MKHPIFSGSRGFGAIWIFVVITILLYTGWYVFLRNPSSSVESSADFSSQSIDTSQQTDLEEILATPMPFAELTIPYLRERSYVSQLNELDQFSDTSTYTSYLTSYDSDGFNIEGLLARPKGEMPEGGWPAVIFIHGYIPPTLYSSTERYQSYVDYLARNGFVVFKIDLRGHGNSEGEAGGAYYSADYIIDTLNAKAALQTSDFVNQEHISLWGHSMAGNVVLRSVAVDPTFSAAVIWAGAVYTYQDLQEYGIDDNSYRPPSQTSERNRRREELFNAHGQFNPDSEFWKQVVPVNYLQDITTPIQVHHAVNDTVVSIEYARNLQRILDGSAIEHQFFEYSSGGHDIEGGSFSQAMQRTVDFYKQHTNSP